MSSNISRGNKTITGEDTLEVDEINIVGDGIGINGNFGTNGQVIKKSTIDNSIGWFDEQTFTATLPIVLQNGQISFNTSMGVNKVSIITSAGKRELLIGNNTANDFIKLQENNGLVLCSLLDVGSSTGAGGINISHNHGINFYSDASTTIKVSIYPAGISVPNDVRSFHIGAHNFRIGDIYCNNIVGQNITASGNFTATTTGSIFPDLQLTGDLDLDGSIIGDGASNIQGINHIYTTDISANGNVNAGGNIQGDTQTNITGINETQSKTIHTKIFKVYADDGLTQQKLAYDGVSDVIQGSGNTDISGITNITASTFLFSNTLAFDGSTLLLGTGPAINKTTGIDMNSTDITELGNLTMDDSNSVLNMSSGNITNCGSITCSTISLSGEIASSNIPSSITGNKTFTGTIQTNGNTTLSYSSGDLFVGNFNQQSITRPSCVLMGSLYRRFNTQSDLVGSGGISGRYEFMRRNRQQERSYFSPYQLSEYYTPNLPGSLYDHYTKLTGDTNRTPYRVIKIHPTNWTPNDDSTANDIAIHDTGSYATTGNITYGGLKARHSAIIEAWSYIDIPEGFKFKAIFIRVASSTSGTSYVSRNVKVFKRHLGEYFTDARFSVKIADGNTATSGNTPIYVSSGAGITDQDLVNEFDNSMAIRCELNNLSYVLGGGYVICEPINPDNMYYTISITSGGSHSSDFTAKILDDLSPNTTLATHTFTAKNQTRNFIVGYTYGTHRRFYVKFEDADDGNDYDYNLNCSLCVVNSVATPTISAGDNNYIELFRQNPTISFDQIAV